MGSKHEKLQKDMNTFVNFLKMNRIKCNMEKTKMIYTDTRTSLKRNLTFKLLGTDLHVLNYKDSLRYLECYFSSFNSSLATINQLISDTSEISKAIIQTKGWNRPIAKQVAQWIIPAKVKYAFHISFLNKTNLSIMQNLKETSSAIPCPENLFFAFIENLSLKIVKKVAYKSETAITGHLYYRNNNIITQSDTEISIPPQTKTLSIWVKRKGKLTILNPINEIINILIDTIPLPIPSILIPNYPTSLFSSPIWTVTISSHIINIIGTFIEHFKPIEDKSLAFLLALKYIYTNVQPNATLSITLPETPNLTTPSYINRRIKQTYSQYKSDITYLIKHKNLNITFNQQKVTALSSNTTKTLDWKHPTFSTTPSISNIPFSNAVTWIKTIIKTKRQLHVRSLKSWIDRPLYKLDSIIVEQHKQLITNEKFKLSAILTFRINILCRNLPTRVKLNTRYPQVYPSSTCLHCNSTSESFEHIFSCLSNFSIIKEKSKSIIKLILELINKSDSIQSKTDLNDIISNLLISGPLLLNWAIGIISPIPDLSVKHKGTIAAKVLKIIFKYIWISRSATANTSPVTGIY
ncbi:5989_t:CDS:2 [Acaulospora colombiana]|uniref:5989_t:CDS:1 n=1 Tax=Acaulospora colombiana TaxID=27376 RepID=A0ACA9K100_9GLOM|nr:5989_t:CDS:2 [Acaulospora colombiana]